MAAVALAVGLAMPAAGAVDVVGQSVRFQWQPATGPLIGYMVFLERNAGGEEFYQATVASQPWVKITGAYGDEIRVRVAAFDVSVNLGPSSPYSDTVRLVEALPTDPTTGGGSDPGTDPTTDPTTDPAPAPDPAPELPPAALDFDGDGRSDLMVHEFDTGDTSVFIMNGSVPIGGRSLPGRSPDLEPVGNGDYNGDRNADTLWLDEAAGELHVELTDPDGGPPLDASTLALPAAYQLGGSVDLDGDGRSDLIVVDLVANDVQVWMMNGASVDRIVSLGRPNGQRIVASGDFDGDGQVEIFSNNPTFHWQFMWQIEGDVVVSRRSYSQNIGASWVPIGTGDYDGNGLDDILWLDQDTGVMYAWGFKPDGTLIQATLSSALPPGAEAVGSGDFDGDGRAEIAVRDESTRRISIWSLDGPTVIKKAPVAVLGPGWSVVGFGGEAPTF